MASTEIVSNLKLITSGNVPTTSNLGNGELAFGLVDGVAKLYGNVNGTIVDFSDFLRTAPVTSVAGKTGAVSLAKDDVGLGNVDNVKQYSASNPPPYPVTSVAGKTGTVILSAEDVGAEPAFHKNTAFNKNFGNISGTVAQGNDSRIVNSVQTSGDQDIWGKKTFMTISPVVPSKTRKATNSGTSIATEAQVYNVEQELSEKQDALTSQQIVNINNVPNKLDKNLGTGLAGQYLVVGDNGDIITTVTIAGGGGDSTREIFTTLSGAIDGTVAGGGSGYYIIDNYVFYEDRIVGLVTILDGGDAVIDYVCAMLDFMTHLIDDVNSIFGVYSTGNVDNYNFDLTLTPTMDMCIDMGDYTGNYVLLKGCSSFTANLPRIAFIGYIGDTVLNIADFNANITEDIECSFTLRFSPRVI